jgi:tripartite-type tricarboxylate transporter receptor subunit TctC
MRRFGRAVVYAFCCLVLVAAQAPAQTYPSKPVRIIVPYAPGGLTDVVARLYSEQLRQSFGRGVVVENKPGASGIIAIEEMAEILAKRAGLDLVHIPFKGGGAEILRDLANGDIHVSWFNITNPVGMMKAGRVRALAIAAEQRLSQHADVPTLAEVGFSGIRAAQWVAAFAPSAVPGKIIQTLRQAFVAAMSVPEMQEAFARGGMLVPRQSALEDAKGWLRDEMASWRRDVEDTGIVVEE